MPLNNAILVNEIVQILVAEDYRKETKGKQNLPKWQDVQKFRTWPPYQASDAYYPFNNSSVEDFTVGTESCENKVGYCNGPLKPGTRYYFKVLSSFNE